MSPAVHTTRWGIMATGFIAGKFSRDLLVNPAVRGVSDIRHEIAAVASASGQKRAQEFLRTIEAPTTLADGTPVAAYGTYQELVHDPNVDVIYVATPHSHHFQNVTLALEAGKPVVCEKALTVNLKQTEKLIETARAKKLFFMEAMWVRFYPLSKQIREAVRDGVIGKVHRVFADLSLPFYGVHPESHRVFNPDLAGGALLDLGIYSLTWAFQTTYDLQEEKETPVVTSSIVKHPVTGTDLTTTVVLNFPKHGVQAITTSSYAVDTQPDGSWAGGLAIRIQGSLGEIAIFSPAYRPEEYHIIKPGKPVEKHRLPIPQDPTLTNDEVPGTKGFGHGMFWEADAAARALRDGQLEAELMPWSESVVVMEVMDKVLKMHKIAYPDSITSTEFDPNHPHNLSR